MGFARGYRPTWVPTDLGTDRPGYRQTWVPTGRIKKVRTRSGKSGPCPDLVFWSTLFGLFEDGAI
eukprot:862612-Prymnesium_polylepis.1